MRFFHSKNAPTVRSHVSPAAPDVQLHHDPNFPRQWLPPQPNPRKPLMQARQFHPATKWIGVFGGVALAVLAVHKLGPNIHGTMPGPETVIQGPSSEQPVLNNLDRPAPRPDLTSFTMKIGDTALLKVCGDARVGDAYIRNVVVAENPDKTYSPANITSFADHVTIESSQNPATAWRQHDNGTFEYSPHPNEKDCHKVMVSVGPIALGGNPNNPTMGLSVMDVKVPAERGFPLKMGDPVHAIIP